LARGGGSGAMPPHKNFENLDAKSYNLRVFWSENVFCKKTVLRLFFFPFKYENNEI
jgi:hypothetical protein